MGMKTIQNFGEYIAENFKKAFELKESFIGVTALALIFSGVIHNLYIGKPAFADLFDESINRHLEIIGLLILLLWFFLWLPFRRHESQNEKNEKATKQLEAKHAGQVLLFNNQINDLNPKLNGKTQIKINRLILGKHLERLESMTDEIRGMSFFGYSEKIGEDDCNSELDKLINDTAAFIQKEIDAGDATLFLSKTGIVWTPVPDDFLSIPEITRKKKLRQSHIDQLVHWSKQLKGILERYQ